MKSNDLVIMGPWLFVIIVWIGSIWIGQEMEFFGIIILFVLALAGSAGLAALVHGKECCEPDIKWANELQSMHSKLDSILKDVEEIRKVIEE